jgi:hypothetical protein
MQATHRTSSSLPAASFDGSDHAGCKHQALTQRLQDMHGKRGAPYMRATEPAVRCTCMNARAWSSKQSAGHGMACKAPCECKHQRTSSAQPHATRLNALGTRRFSPAQHVPQQAPPPTQRSGTAAAPMQPGTRHQASKCSATTAQTQSIPTTRIAVPVPCSSALRCG